MTFFPALCTGRAPVTFKFVPVSLELLIKTPNVRRKSIWNSVTTAAMTRQDRIWRDHIDG